LVTWVSPPLENGFLWSAWNESVRVEPQASQRLPATIRSADRSRLLKRLRVI
jgi:hypothetical protein